MNLNVNKILSERSGGLESKNRGFSTEKGRYSTLLKGQQKYTTNHLFQSDSNFLFIMFHKNSICFCWEGIL